MFEGTAMNNRVSTAAGLAPINRFRVTGVVSETGGVLSVDYADPDCLAPPAKAEENTLRCFPAHWAKKDYAERLDWFHKYVVASVVQSDRISGSPEDVTSYEYVGGAAWHHDTSEFTKADKKSWSEYRGYGRVRTTRGKADDRSGPVTRTEAVYYRGMHGDKLPSGTRTATVTDSAGGVAEDSDWLAGFRRESLVLNGDAVVVKEVTEPVWQGPSAHRGDLRSYLVRPGTVTTRTAVGSGWRTTRTVTAYDDRGLAERVDDLGDTATAADDLCTRTTYARNTDLWLLSYPSKVETVSVACGTAPTYPADAVSAKRTAYDGRAFGDPPSRGDATRVEVLAERPASGEVWAPSSSAEYDAHGRATRAADALDRATTTAYTPVTGGPTTRTVVTDALGHAVTTDHLTANGAVTKSVDANDRVTERAYDPLGRLLEVWLPNRPRASGDGNARHAYRIRNDGASVVTTSTLGPKGTYKTTKTLYDGLLRPRQTQAPAWGGGRLITDTRYDTQGRPHRTTQPYFTDTPLDDELWVAADAAVAGLTLTEHDGAGRVVASAFLGAGTEKWRTTTEYGGDWTKVTPPSGGTVTTAFTDARGRTTELRQHKPGGHDATRYTYTEAGLLETVTDPAGAVWRRGYDLRGRQVRDEDPDKGTSTRTHDHAGQVVTSTDARGRTLTHGHDALGRPTTLRSGATTLVQHTYDTATRGKGRLATSTRYVDGAPYKVAVGGYTSLYRPVSTQVTIPEVEETLSGTYTTSYAYAADGSPHGVTLPAIGDLPQEAVTHRWDDLGKAVGLYGGWDGTVDYVAATDATRYGETARVQLGATDRVWLSHYYDDHTRRLLRSIVDTEVAEPMQADVRYTRDPAGTVTGIADARRGDAQCFRHDHLRRLTEAWTPASGDCAPPRGPGRPRALPPLVHLRRRGQPRHGDQAHPDGHRRPHLDPGPGHRVAAVTATSGDEHYTHDAAGNPTRRVVGAATQDLTWDDEGRLVRVTAGAQVTEFVHTPDGKRLLRRDPTGTTLYLGDQELRLTHADGALTATRYYRFGPQAVAVRTASGLTWLAGDHQGTAALAVEADGLTTTRRYQTPSANPRPAADLPGETGFVGGTEDASVGLTTLGVRQYDAANGRFLSVDPLMDLKDPQQMHGYAYANNSPVTLSDPTGLRPDNSFAGCPGCIANGGINPITGHLAQDCSYVGDNCGRQGQYRRPLPKCRWACDGPVAGAPKKRYPGIPDKYYDRFNPESDRIDHFLALIEYAPNLRGSVNLCVSGLIAWMSVAIGGEQCVSFDRYGLAFNQAKKVGVAFGDGFDLGVDLKADTDLANEVNSGMTFYAEGGAGKGLRRAGAGVQFNPETGDWSGSVSGGFGGGVGKNVGSAGVQFGTNDGYALRWEDVIRRSVSFAERNWRSLVF
ncbi:RHS repeat domain-containing protein [Actinokineospora soli]|uniref:RHS repeat domain-containing protein n=1 Tax=Actinokineospora soli TaxID=1048753 RepID=A0ABW2TX42_9PSEU